MIKGTIDSYELWQSRPENLNENMEDPIKSAENRGWNQCNRSRIKTIEEQPRVGDWIPCSERLPEELVPVNVTWVNRKPEIYYEHIKDKPFTATAIYYKREWYWWSAICEDLLSETGHNVTDLLHPSIEIVAWQTLPEPYKESE